MSDVPLGAFLSGGIDSSSVVAMMAEALPPRRRQDVLDRVRRAELRRVRRTHAAWPRTSAPTTTRSLHAADVMLDLLPTVVDFLDEPFADASILPTYLLSRFTRESRHRRPRRRRQRRAARRLPDVPGRSRRAPLPRCRRLLHERVVVPLADRLPVSTANFSLDFKLKRFLRGAALPADVRHATWLGSFTPAEQAALLDRDPGDPFAEQRARVRAAPTGTTGSSG